MRTSPSLRAAAIVVFGALTAAACGEAPMAPSSDGDLTPVLSVLAGPGITVDGNPTCADLGYDFGFKIDNFPRAELADGQETYTIAWGDHTFGTVTVTTSDQTTFSWTSDFGIDGVISKGGNAGQVFAYDNATGDEGLYSPERTNKKGKVLRPALSHIDFCFGLEVEVSKTAVTSFTRDYDWQITKTASASSLEVAKDGSGSVTYTVNVSSTGYEDSDWAVDGVITITNPTPFPATITDLSDIMTGEVEGVLACALPIEIDAGASATCAYSAALGGASTRTNTASAATDASAVYGPGAGGAEYGNGLKIYGSGSVGGGEGSADVVFGEPTNVLDETVTVSDDLSTAVTGTFGLGGASFTYSLDFAAACDNPSRDVVNTASFTGSDGETGSASATVTVTTTNCDGEPPLDYQGETAFAYSAQGLSTCFLNIDANNDGIVDFNRWGWTTGPIQEGGEATLELWAAAGRCNLGNGEKVGTVTVSYEGGTLTATYSIPALSAWSLEETHLYAGNEKLARNNGVFTVAPGQYGHIHGDLATGTKTDTFTVTGLSGPIYLVAHAAVVKAVVR